MPVSGCKNKQVELLISYIVSRLSRMLRWRQPGASMLMLALCSLPAQAELVAVVLSDDAPHYHQAAEAIEAVLKPQHTVYKVLGDRLTAGGPALSRASLLVAVGVRAADQLSGLGGNTPVLAVLVTEDWYRNRGAAKLSAGGRNAGVLVLEQPFSRQLRLVRHAFPKASRLGAVVGRKNAALLDELRAVADSSGLVLVGAVTEPETPLVATLGQVLKEADLLLAVPDAEVLNRNTVQSVLMTTYRYRDPMVGYSKALSRAGALVSLYSTPEQVGRQAGEIATRVLDGARLPELQWPKYFTVSINGHVARSLGIDMPSEETLLGELGGGND